MAVWYPLADSW